MRADHDDDWGLPSEPDDMGVDWVPPPPKAAPAPAPKSTRLRDRVKFKLIELDRWGNATIRMDLDDEKKWQGKFKAGDDRQENNVAIEMHKALGPAGQVPDFDDDLTYSPNSGDDDDSYLDLYKQGIRAAIEGEDEELPEAIDFADLAAENPEQPEAVIDGLIRRGDVGNIIADPKVGKSWLLYYIALCAIMGWFLFDRFKCRPGRVLLVDYELHRATIVHRIHKVADAMGIDRKILKGRLSVISLRGKNLDINALASALKKYQPGEFDLGFIDALYKAMPAGVSENDNAAMTQVFNTLIGVAADMDCAMMAVHHSSKGDQSGKKVTDVGSGAGAQSRAADCHLVLRQHEEPGVVVMDGVVRSFKPVDPLALKWDFPLWRPVSDVDPSKLKGRGSKQDERQAEQDRAGIEKITGELQKAPAVVRNLVDSIGISRERIQRLLAMMTAEGLVIWQDIEVKGRTCRQYELTPQEDMSDWAGEWATE